MGRSKGRSKLDAALARALDAATAAGQFDVVDAIVRELNGRDENAGV